jgi:hypothetical protein
MKSPILIGEGPILPVNIANPIKLPLGKIPTGGM